MCAPWARLLLHQLLRGDGAPARMGAPSSPVPSPFPSWCCARGCPALAREDPQRPQGSEAGQLLAPVGYKPCPNRWGQRVPGEEPRSTSQGCKAVTQLLCCSCFLTRVTFPPPAVASPRGWRAGEGDDTMGGCHLPRAATAPRWHGDAQGAGRKVGWGGLRSPLGQKMVVEGQIGAGGSP